MLELKILIDDVDYNSLTELLVPLLAAGAVFWAAYWPGTRTWPWAWPGRC